MKNNTKLIIAFVVVVLLTAVVFVVSKNSNNSNDLSDTQSVQSQTGESMDENLSSIEKAKKKLTTIEKDRTKNPPVDVNTDVKAYVEALGGPSEADRARIEKAMRYGEEGFEAGLREMLTSILGKIDEETIQKIVGINMKGAYQFDVLRERYAYGEIDEAFFVKTAHESSLLIDDEHKAILTDEQYVAYSGGVPKGQEKQNDLAVLVTDEAIFLDFPNITKVRPEMQSIDELYALVDPTIVSDLVQFTEDHQRAGMRLDIQTERGEISMEDAMELSEQDNDSYDNYVRSVLTPEQQDLFLGEPYVPEDEEVEDGIDDEEYDDAPVLEGSEEWNDLIAEGATPEAIREFNETGVLYFTPKEQK